VLQTSRQVVVFLPGVMSPAKCVARSGFMVLYGIIQQEFLLRVVHFITSEERVFQLAICVSPEILICLYVVVLLLHLDVNFYLLSS
jgi:hypothetical protein